MDQLPTFAASATDQGVRYKALNQDASLVHQIPATNYTLYLFGVFDGHGKAGELAAETASQSIKKFLHKKLPKLDHASPEWSAQAEKLVSESFHKAHKDIIALYPTLRKYTDYKGQEWTLYTDDTSEKQSVYKQSRHSHTADLQDFGTTAILAVLLVVGGKPTKLVVANAGDSPAFIGKKGTDEPLVGELLTPCLHNKDNKEELARVDPTLELDGIYFNVRQAISPNYYFYGLAMSRALGHRYMGAWETGVIWNPTVHHYNLTEDHQILVLCSDGVSDVMTTQEIFDYLHSLDTEKNTAEFLADSLVQESIKSWTRKWPKPKHPTEITDNTTAVVVDLRKACN